MKIISTAGAYKSQGIKILVYGKSGSGKTFLCRTSQSPIIISTEDGLLSLQDYNIPVIVSGDENSFNDALKWVESSTEATQFKTVCIDSLTELGSLILRSEKTKVRDQRQAYVTLSEKIILIIKRLRSLIGRNVVVLAQEELNKDDYTGTHMYRASMPGTKLCQQIPYLFDEVFYLSVIKNVHGTLQRSLLTQSNKQYDAKDRSGRLDILEPPDITHIISKILRPRV